jgi:hypothetical protein
VTIFGNKHFGDALDYSRNGRKHKGGCLIKRNSVWSGSQGGRSSALWSICKLLTTRRHTAEDNLQRTSATFSEMQRHSDKFSKIQRRNQFLEVIKISCSYVYKCQLLGTATLNPLYFKSNTREAIYIYCNTQPRSLNNCDGKAVLTDLIFMDPCIAV